MRTIPALCLALVLSGLPAGPAAAGDDLARYVDPFIGTFGAGFVFPGAAAPYGMVQLSPDTDGYFAYSGYQYTDRFIRGFSHVHVESMGVPMGGNVPFMPTVGPTASTDPLLYMSGFDHAAEDASPGYYGVALANGVRAELTAGLRVGMHRYSFPPGPEANILIDAGRSVPRGSDPLRPGTHRAAVNVVGDRDVFGTAYTNQGYPVHFWAQFDRPFVNFGTWDAPFALPQSGRRTVDAAGAGAALTFPGGTAVRAKVGISFVSAENAFENLAAELPGDDFDFDALRRRTRETWNEALRSITVDGGTTAHKTSFYTALYHAQHHPNVFTDADGTYLGHDGAVHTADGYTHYANFSLWDTYRGQMQLLATIAPDRYRDMLRSLLEMHNESGRLPRWALMNRTPNYMMGDPALISIADGFCRGLVDAELSAPLYEAMRHAMLGDPRDRHFADPEMGWVPHDVSGRGASQTLENSLAAFALALVADRLGHTADRDAALALAGNYRKVLDSGGTGWVRPRLSNGDWVEPYHPEMPDGYQEGTGWQWSWMVPHDVDGLFAGMGGDQVVRERLDVHFGTPVAQHVPAVLPEAQKHITAFGLVYYGNQYAPGNEHELHAPYLYNWIGEPHKTQGVVRGLQALYRPTPDGLPGNDDLGSMSAWYIWSALGFYPAVAGAPIHVLGSPLFEKARLRVAGGVFTVSAPGAGEAAKYVRAASLDGVPLDASWFPAASLEDGGRIDFRMGLVPSDAPIASPPSVGADGLGAFGCRPT